MRRMRCINCTHRYRLGTFEKVSDQNDEKLGSELFLRRKLVKNGGRGFVVATDSQWNAHTTMARFKRRNSKKI